MSECCNAWSNIKNNCNSKLRDERASADPINTNATHLAHSRINVAAKQDTVLGFSVIF
jgi:hypothetical protein